MINPALAPNNCLLKVQHFYLFGWLSTISRARAGHRFSGIATPHGPIAGPTGFTSKNLQAASARFWGGRLGESQWKISEKNKSPEQQRADLQRCSGLQTCVCGRPYSWPGAPQQSRLRFGQLPKLRSFPFPNGD